MKNNFNARKVKRHIDYIDNKIAEYEQALDNEFNQETKTKLEYNHQKKENYLQINQQLKENVMGEVYLAFTTYNLRRLASIFDFKTLMSKMKAHFGNFLTVLSSLFNKIGAFVSQLQKRWVLKPLFSKNELLFM